MKKEARERQGSPEAFIAPPDPLLKDRPLLAQAVADLWWDDGTPREPWSLSLNWSLGLVRASLTDKEECRSISSDGETVSKALNALESAMGMPQRPWRYWGKKKTR